MKLTCLNVHNFGNSENLEKLKKENTGKIEPSWRGTIGKRGVQSRAEQHDFSFSPSPGRSCTRGSDLLFTAVAIHHS